jgi:sugar-specific transcriptional regulator TrmB
MKHENRGELVELGLSPAEAQIYLVLLQNASLSASAIAAASGVSRSSVYQMLCSLADRGLIEAGTGYGSKFAVVAPDQALPALVARERETLAQREELASRLGQRLVALTNEVEGRPEELIQVIRDRRAVAERFVRLQLEAERQIVAFVKPPFFTRQGNPAQEKAQRRGVHYKGLYEKAALEEDGIKPYFHKWLTAGEEARIYDGELPHKLAIFDSKIALMPLILPGERMKAVLIRHPQLVQTLSLGFQFLWENAEPVARPSRKKTARPAKSTGRNENQLLHSNSDRQ